MMDIHTPQGMTDAKRWMQNLINTIADGGMWAIPRSGTILVFDKKNKRVRVTHQLMPDISIARVLEAMGWEITYKISKH